MPAEYEIGSKTSVAFLGLRSEIVDVIQVEVLEKETCGVVTCALKN